MPVSFLHHFLVEEVLMSDLLWDTLVYKKEKGRKYLLMHFRYIPDGQYQTAVGT
jgi:hypothetical protein